jgi:asparagine synthase (glutamine-hydrolysing)
MEAALLTPGVPGAAPVADEPRGLAPGADPVNAVSRYELTGYMLNTLLRDTDSMSMACSLEVRVPFVDREVIRAVLPLPGPWKLARNRPKPLLLDALDGRLPPRISERPKMGFGLPFPRWLCSILAEEVDEVLKRDASRVAALGLVPERVAALWQRFRAAPERVGWSRPWALYVLVRWCTAQGVAT